MFPAFEVKTLLANVAVTATGLSAALDLSDYEGPVAIVLDATAQGVGITNAIKVTESATSGGSYTDVSGGGFTTVANASSKQIITLNSDDMMKFIKLNMTVAGGSGTGSVACSVVGFKKYR